MSCHTGRVDEGVDAALAAQQVAEILGVPVPAPTQPVGVSPNLIAATGRAGGDCPPARP
ncbi:hypothetical protein [Actinoplanes sp. NPDC049599]|uniref:hypothetical protein n=1 Tax=Actinoplanes sp. NPDC049599 TaxID=3363903 RepID=UPI00378B33D5